MGSVRKRSTRNLSQELLNNEKYRQTQRELNAARERLMDSHGLNGSTVQVLKRNVVRLMAELDKIKKEVRDGGQ